MWNIGATGSQISPWARVGQPQSMRRIASIIARWLWMIALEMPVVPPVNISAAGASGETSRGVQTAGPRAARASGVKSPSPSTSTWWPKRGISARAASAVSGTVSTNAGSASANSGSSAGAG